MAKMFIGGESVGAGSGQTYDVTNPATGEIVGSAPKGNESDARAAIDSAAAAFSAWAETSAEARAQLILKGIEAVKKEIGDLSVLLTQEQGKPVGDSHLCADWPGAHPAGFVRVADQQLHSPRIR